MTCAARHGRVSWLQATDHHGERHGSAPPTNRPHAHSTVSTRTGRDRLRGASVARFGRVLKLAKRRQAQIFQAEWGFARGQPASASDRWRGLGHATFSSGHGRGGKVFQARKKCQGFLRAEGIRLKLIPCSPTTAIPPHLGPVAPMGQIRGSAKAVERFRSPVVGPNRRFGAPGARLTRWGPLWASGGYRRVAVRSLMVEGVRPFLGSDIVRHEFGGSEPESSRSSPQPGFLAAKGLRQILTPHMGDERIRIPFHQARFGPFRNFVCPSIPTNPKGS